MKLFTRQSFRQSAIALVLTAAALSACDTQTTTTTTTDPAVTDRTATGGEVAPGQVNVEAGDLTENVEAYVGRTVSVRGNAGDTVGNDSFLLQDDRLFGGDEILVFNATGTPFILPTGEFTEDVQVTGEVRQFVIADVERAYGLSLERNLYTDYENRPAIIAESIALAPDPAEISDNPSVFYNQTIAVEGRVNETTANNTLTINNSTLFGGEDLLVLVPQPIGQFVGDEDVVVTGQLRPFVVADFERDYGFNWDQGFVEQLEAEYRNRPVLVAEGIYPTGN